MALSRKLEEIKNTFQISSGGASDFNKTSCCSFLHNFKPKTNVEIYIHLTKAERFHSDEVFTKWLKILKSIGFKFEFLQKNDIFVIGIQNQDYETSWQMYLLYCLIRWNFYEPYKGLVTETFKVREALPRMPWFECMQIAHGLPFNIGNYWSGGMSMYQGSSNMMVRLKPIKKFLATKAFSGMNNYFYGTPTDYILISTPPTIEMFKNQKNLIKKSEEERKKQIEAAIEEMKANPEEYEGAKLYRLRVQYGSVPFGTIVRDARLSEFKKFRRNTNLTRAQDSIKEVVFPTNINGSYITNLKGQLKGISVPMGAQYIEEIEVK